MTVQYKIVAVNAELEQIDVEFPGTEHWARIQLGKPYPQTQADLEAIILQFSPHRPPPPRGDLNFIVPLVGQVGELKLPGEVDAEARVEPEQVNLTDEIDLQAEQAELEEMILRDKIRQILREEGVLS